MELVTLVCLSLVAWSGIASADGSTVLTQVVKEDGDTVLECSLGKNAQGTVFSWSKDGSEKEEVFIFRPPNNTEVGRLFQGRVDYFPKALQSGNASILIKRAKVSDNGTYTCEFPTDSAKIRAIISLTVGASPKPIIKTLQQTEDGVPVLCVVTGASPKPVLELNDNEGKPIPGQKPNVTEGDRKYNVTLQIMVKTPGLVRCVATQDEIKHQISAETFVNMNHAGGGLSTGSIIVIVICVVVVLIIAIAVIKNKC